MLSHDRLPVKFIRRFAGSCFLSASIKRLVKEGKVKVVKAKYDLDNVKVSLSSYSPVLLWQAPFLWERLPGSSRVKRHSRLSCAEQVQYLVGYLPCCLSFRIEEVKLRMCYSPLQIIHAYRSERACVIAILLRRELRCCRYNQRQQVLPVYRFSCNHCSIPFPEHFLSPAIFPLCG